MHSRNEYLKVIKESYFKVNTRKYIIWKIQQAILKPKQRKKRKEKYDVPRTPYNRLMESGQIST